MPIWPRAVVLVLLGAALAVGTPTRAQGEDDRRVLAALERIGASVEHFYARVRSVVADVQVRIQPMRRDMSPNGRVRRLFYEMRVEWEAGAQGEAPDPVVTRVLLEADGRPPDPDDEPECADPELVTTEPLAVFLPARREDYRFRWVGRDREADREAIVLDYVPRNEEAPTVTWDENCVSVDAPGMTRGRVWADASSGDVLRVDERLSGMFEFSVPFEHNRGNAPLHMALERAESSVRYRPVGFSDPAEVLLLPTSIEMMTIWRNTGVTRQLVTHDISNYRRFVTSSRILKSPHRR